MTLVRAERDVELARVGAEPDGRPLDGVDGLELPVGEQDRSEFTWMLPFPWSDPALPAMMWTAAFMRAEDFAGLQAFDPGVEFPVPVVISSVVSVRTTHTAANMLYRPAQAASTAKG